MKELRACRGYLFCFYSFDRARIVETPLFPASQILSSLSVEPSRTRQLAYLKVYETLSDHKLPMTEVELGNILFRQYARDVVVEQ